MTTVSIGAIYIIIIYIFIFLPKETNVFVYSSILYRFYFTCAVPCIPLDFATTMSETAETSLKPEKVNNPTHCTPDVIQLFHYHRTSMINPILVGHKIVAVVFGSPCKLVEPPW